MNKFLSLFSKQEADPLGLKQEFQDLMRGITGGLLFGMPVLYTMEVWFDSLKISPGLNVVILISFLLLNILFSFFAGLRERHSSERLSYAIDDGITSLGIAIILSVLILFLIGRIDFEYFGTAQLSHILLEAGIVSVGITFTNFKFKEQKSQSHSMKNILNESFISSPDKKQIRKDLSDIAAATIGALIFSFNIAPTEEVTYIAAGLSSLQLIFIIFVELLLAYIILYASGLKGQIVYSKGSFFQHPVNEVVLTTSVSLIVASILISFIGYRDFAFLSHDYLANIIVLSFPGTVGAAAGRLVL